MKILIVLTTLAGFGATQQYTTPVPILKQINRQNEDGSYSFGYEGADGSFKIETKYPTGEVYGKYGYVDDAGKVREVEYGASKRGFEPQGTDINVPPPTLNNENHNAIPLGPNEEDDGQYREDPSIYYKDSRFNTRRVSQAGAAPVHTPAYNQQSYSPGPRQYFENAPAPVAPRYQTQAQPQPQPQPQPHYQSQPQYHQPQYPTHAPAHRFHSQPNYYQPRQTDQYRNHPALNNLDTNTGSYSLNYSG